ncbi:MAG: TraB/GumN family protein [Clostridiales bacterium]|nr:TraB/GumN family protein [Clostridiales bacterium]
MKTLWKRFACMAVALVTPTLLCSCEEKPPVQGICYRITGGRNPMVILGSIHVGSPEMEPYGQHILDAMTQADTFVFECDNESPEAAAQSLAMMTLTEGTLQEVVSPELWPLLTDACQLANLHPDALATYKPWAVTSMLTTAAAAREMGARSSRQAVSRSVESEVLDHVGSRQLRYLETAVSQLSLMDAFSPALQEALLRQSCQAVLEPQENTTLSQWPLWWRDGDADAFAAEYAQDNSLPPALMEEYHHALVTNRNQHMAASLAQMLEEEDPRSFFVTIGLMHLVLPEDSVLYELTRMGYTVERMWLPAP